MFHFLVIFCLEHLSLFCSWVLAHLFFFLIKPFLQWRCFTLLNTLSFSNTPPWSLTVSMRVHSYADDVFRQKSNTSLLFTQCIIDAADSTTGASISFVEARAGTGEHLTGINRCLPADHSGVWHLPVLQRPSYGAPAQKDEDGIPAWILVQSSCQPKSIPLCSNPCQIPSVVPTSLCSAGPVWQPFPHPPVAATASVSFGSSLGMGMVCCWPFCLHWRQLSCTAGRVLPFCSAYTEN